jgi:hypothetical protein
MMTDIPRLAFSPLTHEELNNRTHAVRDEAGGYALAVMRGSKDFHELHLEQLQALSDEFDAYLAASVARCVTFPLSPTTSSPAAVPPNPTPAG